MSPNNHQSERHNRRIPAVQAPILGHGCRQGPSNGTAGGGCQMGHHSLTRSSRSLPGARGQRGLYVERSSRHHLGRTVQLRTNKLTGPAGAAQRARSSQRNGEPGAHREEPTDGARLRNAAQNHQPALLKRNGKKVK